MEWKGTSLMRDGRRHLKSRTTTSPTGPLPNPLEKMVHPRGAQTLLAQGVEATEERLQTRQGDGER